MTHTILTYLRTTAVSGIVGYKSKQCKKLQFPDSCKFTTKNLPMAKNGVHAVYAFVWQ